jgi:hypothetical protein
MQECSREKRRRGKQTTVPTLLCRGFSVIWQVRRIPPEFSKPLQGENFGLIETL